MTAICSANRVFLCALLFGFGAGCHRAAALETPVAASMKEEAAFTLRLKDLSGEVIFTARPDGAIVDASGAVLARYDVPSGTLTMALPQALGAPREISIGLARPPSRGAWNNIGNRYYVNGLDVLVSDSGDVVDHRADGALFRVEGYTGALEHRHLFRSMMYLLELHGQTDVAHAGVRRALELAGAELQRCLSPARPWDDVGKTLPFRVPRESTVHGTDPWRVLPLTIWIAEATAADTLEAARPTRAGAKLHVVRSDESGFLALVEEWPNCTQVRSLKNGLTCRTSLCARDPLTLALTTALCDSLQPPETEPAQPAQCTHVKWLPERWDPEEGPAELRAAIQRGITLLEEGHIAEFFRTVASSSALADIEKVAKQEYGLELDGILALMEENLAPSAPALIADLRTLLTLKPLLLTGDDGTQRAQFYRVEPPKSDVGPTTGWILEEGHWRWTMAP